MSRPRILLFLTAVVSAGGLLVLPRHSRGVAYAAEVGSTPGQLTILDQKGQPAGLCPLKHTDVDADVTGYVARVTVKQQFNNPSTEPIEAIYTFPLPADAAVDDMTMTIGERVIKGEIKRREEARQIYDAARAAGQSAALLDQERPNIFTQSVANIMPGQDVAITISFVNLLKYDDGRYEFSFPMVVGPRYVPAGGYTVPGQRGDPSPKSAPGAGPSFYPEGGSPASPTFRPQARDRRLLPLVEPARESPTGNEPLLVPQVRNARAAEVGALASPAPKPATHLPNDASPGTPGSSPAAVVTDADRITPPITPPGTRAGHDISLAIHLDAGVPIQDIRSVLHPVTVTREGPNQALIRLKDEATLPNKDFILRYVVAGSQLQSGLLSTAESDGSGYFTLILQPPMAPPQSQISPKEMVFVIDQTGSQSGWPIEKAKETMRYALQNMNPGDTFQLIGFNTALFPCFPTPVPNTPENVRKALAFLARIEGNGGTDILKSVDYALKLPDDPNRLRIVCYMTDGYVGNDMQILDYIRKNRGRARMFPFGIGNSVNRFLIDGMAKEGQGAADYVTLDEPGQEAAVRFYRRIASPLLLDPQVDWGGLPVADIYPHQIPDVFTAGPIILKGRYTHPGEGDVVVRGLLRGRPWNQRLHVILPNPDGEGDAISTLWARDRIEDLQAQDWIGAQTGSPSPGITEQIVRTALEHRLMSQYTSFVAVEERVVNIGGKFRRMDVPVEMPEGVSYDGIFGKDQSVEMLGRTSGMGAGGALGTPLRYAGLMAKSAAVARAPMPVAAAQNAAAGGGSYAPSSAPSPVLRQMAEAADKPAESGALSLSEREIADGRPNARKQLAAMKPEDRRALIARVKLDPSLLSLAAKVKAEELKAEELKAEGRGGSLHKPGLPEVTAGRVDLVIWLNAVPPDGMKRLKALGFTVAATFRPTLLLGTLPVDKLDDLIALEFVRRVQPPKYR